MPLHECPGPDRKKQNIPGEVACPYCGEDVEIWTNDMKATCPSCSKEITRGELESCTKEQV